MSNPPSTSVSGRKSRGDEGIHLAIDLSQGSALAWVGGELAVALADIGQRVSIPRTGGLSGTLEPRLRARLPALMAARPCRTYHVKLNHYWPQFLKQEISGEVNAELFVTNYRFRGEIHPLDMWSRNLVTNGVCKLPMSTFCRDSLTDLGVAADRCAVVPPGYSPEIESLFPRPKPPRAAGVRRLFVVTNSHDLNRYGTDILVRALAQAYTADDPVEIHIKDYGASAGSRTLRESIAAHASFPKVVWHETFLGKEELIRLYGEMDLMICPFRGEGYAMKIIDAMAVGLPVMMPAFGGPLEYAPQGGYLPLPFDEIAVGPCLDTDQYLVGPGAYWCEVREASFVEALRSYLADPAAADRAAAVARDHVYGRFTWAHAARCLVTALQGWQAERERTLSHRRRPAARPLSVIMPTKDRPVELAKTLQGYAVQADDAFEIVLVNDHGDGRAVRDIVASVGKNLRVTVIDNDGRPGPGAARNLGLQIAEGDVFLVTGDDIIPTPDLVARHRDAHRRHPDTEDAFVGMVAWHPEMKRAWFTDHIVGAGGQQFVFGDLVDGQELSFHQFYTSNVSWKRSLTADCEQIFSEAFRDAAFEDVELGYRLSRRGMRLRFLAGADGLHLHPMTARTFLARMRRVGRMRTVLAAMHPGLMPKEDAEFFQDLEVERRRRLAGPASVEPRSPDSLLEPVVQVFEELDGRIESPPVLSGAASRLAADQDRRLGELRRSLFDDLCDSFMRMGQAEEWARGSPDEEWAAAWVARLRLARLGATQSPVPATLAHTRASSPAHSQAPPSANPLKRWLLRYPFARAIRSSVREWKRRRR